MPFFPLSVDLVPDVGFRDLGISRKLVMSNFQRHKACSDLSSDHQTAIFGTRAAGVISLLANCFPTKIPGNSEILLANRDNQVVGDSA